MVAKTDLPASVQERDPAPEVEVALSTVRVDERFQIVDELNRKNPEYVHKYQSATVSSQELERKGQVVVKDEKGRTITHMGDPVVRMKRTLDEALRKQRNQESLELAKQIAPVALEVDGNLERVAQPKKVTAKPRRT